MVKKLIIKMLYVALFFLALLYFLPKEHLYYLLQQELKEQKITLTQKSLQEKSFGLALENLTVSYEGVPVATIKHLDCTLFVFYNNLKAEGVTLSALTSSYLPPKLSYINANYSIVHPLNIDIEAKGAFGFLHVTMNVLEKRISAQLKPSHILQSNYRRSLRYLKREKNGEYSYAKSFK